MNKNIKTIGQKCMESHPDRIPIIVQYNNIIFTGAAQNKFLVQKEALIAHLLVIIRRNSKITHKDSLCIFIDNILINSNVSVSSLYSKYKNLNDDCLHITVTKENTFGNQS